MNKYVYLFNEGNKDMRDLLGGKGANLAEMTNLGIPVPSGFTITTECCKYYNQNGEINSEMLSQIDDAITKLENKTGKFFGKVDNPLLLSVRSGAKISMPGMMDSVLNIGLNDEIVASLEKKANPRFVYDSYRRLIQMFSDVVMGFDKNEFEKIIENVKKEKNIELDIDLSVDDLIRITNEYKILYKKLSGEDFPSNPKEQLLKTINAVFNSWNNERAKIYRKMNNISDDLGTAVNVQEMVYGNYSNESGTGVAFSRNPSTGENILFGEFLLNAQGEDVVAGVRTPLKIDELKEFNMDIYNEFYSIAKKLEKHYKDMQDMEFTIQDNKLYVLQTRNGKRTGLASINISVDFVKEGIITKEEAIERVSVDDLTQALHKTFNIENMNVNILTKGLNASPGAATGRICFNSKDVISAKANDEEVVLVRKETSPEDIDGMREANGLLTATGGMTSHAAVVMRGMGKCCVSGAKIEIDEVNKTVTFDNDVILKEGDYISLDGSTGIVYEGKLETIDPEIAGNFKTFMSWAKEIKKLKVFANADTETDANLAIKFGADGLGLARTEHMFFNKNRILSFRKMILSDSESEKNQSLKELLQYQKEDFIRIFKSMDGKTVTIRYLDPPLHEFLPKDEDSIIELSKNLNISTTELKNRINSLKEFNPMMGHRGVRLLISEPEIVQMQTKAIAEALIESGANVNLDLMIPLISDVNELKYIKNIIIKELESINFKSNYKIGVMIETPRAALLAPVLAKEADFFSFGSNDLTQFTYGFSRDDAKFLNKYYDENIFSFNPFETIDTSGVGLLMVYTKENSKKVNKNIKIGICGEQAGEEKTVDFCNRIGLDYVSCSSYRVPLAILSAAKSEISRRSNV